jgi:transcriptional regulator
MRKSNSDLLRGTLDLLILKALSLEPLHGVGISKRIRQVTGEAFQVSYGSLFPSLHRMEEKGWVAAEWRASENNRRAKYYRLTAAGRRQAASEERDWNRVVELMTLALKSFAVRERGGLMFGRLASLFRKRQIEQDLDDELRLVWRCSQRDLMREGLSPQEALRQARIELGASSR